jgi:hypothetical protein
MKLFSALTAASVLALMSTAAHATCNSNCGSGSPSINVTGSAGVGKIKAGGGNDGYWSVGAAGAAGSADVTGGTVTNTSFANSANTLGWSPSSTTTTTGSTCTSCGKTTTTTTPSTIVLPATASGAAVTGGSAYATNTISYTPNAATSTTPALPGAPAPAAPINILQSNTAAASSSGVGTGGGGTSAKSVGFNVAGGVSGSN